MLNIQRNWKKRSFALGIFIGLFLKVSTIFCQTSKNFCCVRKDEHLYFLLLTLCQWKLTKYAMKTGLLMFKLQRRKINWSGKRKKIQRFFLRDRKASEAFSLSLLIAKIALRAQKMKVHMNCWIISKIIVAVATCKMVLRSVLKTRRRIEF